MYWQRPFVHGVSGDGSVRGQQLIATFTVVEVADEPPDGTAVDSPAGPLDQPAATRTDVTSRGLRVVGDRVGEAVVVRAIGEVDARNADGLASALRAGVLAARRPGPLVVDLGGIKFCSVAGIELLIVTEQHCREKEVELRVVASRCVLRALRITGLDVLFTITTTLARATRAQVNPQWTARH